MSNENNPATSTDRLIINNLGVLFNKQATVFNADVAALVQMCASMIDHMEHHNMLSLEAGSRFGDAGDDEHAISEIWEELHTYVEEETRELLAAENPEQDVDAVMENVHHRFCSTVTLIAYIYNLPMATKYVMIDRTSIAALNELQVTHQQIKEDEAAEEQAH